MVKSTKQKIKGSASISANERMDTSVLINKKVEESKLKKLLSCTSASDPVLFAVADNVTNDARYGASVLAITASHMFLYDLEREECLQRLAFSDIERIFSKRMYGNGIIRARMKNGSTCTVFRYTLSTAPLGDAVQFFVRSVCEGESVENAMLAVKMAYDKLLSVCTKCGRALAAPGAPCVHCMQKGGLVKRLIKYLKPEILPLSVSVIISVITTALALIPPLFTKFLVDEILPNSDVGMLWTVVISLVAITVVQYGLSAVHACILRVSGARIVGKLRKEVYEKAQFLPLRFYDKTSMGGVMTRIDSDTATIQAFILRVTQEVLVQAFKLIGIIVIMLCIDWKLALLSLIPVPIAAVFARIFSQKTWPFYLAIRRKVVGFSSILTDSLPGIKVTKSFANEKGASKKFDVAVDEWQKTDSKHGKLLSAYPSIVAGVMAFGSIIIWALGGNMVIGGATASNGTVITAGFLVSFISYATMFYEPVNFFTNFVDSVNSAANATERIMEILDAEPEHDFGKGNTSVDMGGRIEFKNVNFSYDRTKKVLKNINLTIEPGDIVGVVGTTGSGKSTLVNLLMRFYDHYDGQITIDGVDIRNVDMKYYRENIGYVQQEPMMFHDTIYNNISYGGEDFTVEQVIRAAEIANAHEFIVRQPDGYDTMLGERGVGLSGGERQRLSIARAMLRDPKMLIFDEATASVDSETEHLIQGAIEGLITGRTTIMIAHRLSTLSKANKIVVVDNGEIIECGTPAELMALRGKYYKLVSIQTMSERVENQKREERFE